MTKNIEDASEPYVSTQLAGKSKASQPYTCPCRYEIPGSISGLVSHADIVNESIHLSLQHLQKLFDKVFKNLIHSPQLNTRVSEQCGHSSKKGL
ncbi:hypothetical protein AAHA92_19514 [Salvia divinorum]|uniref:Uncharacterized protein n=1 Tax=Salvia divinorum TaxID=28513 RepID=A0ABD1H5M5_SALDI